MITRRKTLELLTSGSLLALSSCSQGDAHSNWRFYEGNPVIGGQYGTCFDPYVILDGGKFRMWFSWRPKHSIAYCESQDGISWSAPQIVLGVDPTQEEQTEVNRCTVVRRDGLYQALLQSWCPCLKPLSVLVWSTADERFQGTTFPG